jgi:hypothetical protein
MHGQDLLQANFPAKVGLILKGISNSVEMVCYNYVKAKIQSINL